MYGIVEFLKRSVFPFLTLSLFLFLNFYVFMLSLSGNVSLVWSNVRLFLPNANINLSLLLNNESIQRTSKAFLNVSYLSISIFLQAFFCTLSSFWLSSSVREMCHIVHACSKMLLIYM